MFFCLIIISSAFYIREYFCHKLYSIRNLLFDEKILDLHGVDSAKIIAIVISNRSTRIPFL